MLPNTHIDHEYEMRQLDIFKTMVEKGKWCVVSRIYAAHSVVRAHLQAASSGLLLTVLADGIGRRRADIQ